MSANGPRKLPEVPDFPPEEVNASVLLLLEICHQQHAETQALRDEIARLKGGNPRAPIKPSKLESKEGGTNNKDTGKGRDKNKRSKTHRLESHDEVVVAPAMTVPAGSRFKGHDDFTVQDLHIEARNTRYRLVRWVSPDGETLRGELPAGLDGGHFAATLRAFILYQYHHAHVTQALLLDQLGEWGIELSAGQMNRLITEPGEAFHAEKEALLRAGLQCSACVHVELLALAHERSCEGELAGALTVMLEAGETPDIAPLRARFGPAPHRLPRVSVKLPSLAGYDTLLTPGVTSDTTGVAVPGERP